MKTNTRLKQRLLIFFVTIFSLQHAFAQRNCGTTSHEDYLRSKDSKRESKLAEYRKLIETYQPQNNKTAVPSVTIPVVVHVVYNTASQNISNAQIISQINVLNQDFGRTNSDTTNTPTAFKPIAANTGIQFCLAQRDPAGNPTNGIERRSTTVTSFTTDDKVKFFSQGGLDIWDPSRYLNIWVCNMGGGLLGYGEFPTGSLSNTFGAVIQYNAFGNTGTVSAPFNLGRTCTHEFSHCFNLYHIWGDDGTACTGSDLCTDTPNQAGATSGCFAFPKTDACSPASPGIQFMNYMDYSDDNCMNMFTTCQSTRMNNVLNSLPYSSLKTSNGCSPVILATNDAGVPSVINPTGTFCNTTFTPNIVLKNWGTSTLTTAFVNYKIDLNPLQTYTWTGSLASLASVTISLPTLTASIGTHTFIAYSTSPNTTADGNNNNDTTRINFSILGIGQSLPFTEGFEAVAFPPTGFSLNNPDAATTWARTTAAAKLGVASARMDNYNYSSGSGQRDELVLPSLNLTSIGAPLLTFDLAYKLYTNPSLNPNYSDTLEVLISTDCGVTFNSLYKKFALALATTTPNWANSAFVPTSSQWRTETVPLTSYSSINNAIIKFRNVSDYENYLYLDNINISGSTGILEASESNGVFIYPNPSTGVINIQMQNFESQPVTLTIFNANGQTVQKRLLSEKQISEKVDISSFASGLYFVQIVQSGIIYQKKVILNK